MIRMICGLPRKGKTYMMTRDIVSALERKANVFSNFPVSGESYVLEFEDLLESEFPEESDLFIDEANMWFRNRDWSKFPKECFLLFMHHGHFKLNMTLIAQIPTTVDVNIRDIVNEFVWVSNFTLLNQTEGKPKNLLDRLLHKPLWYTCRYYSTCEGLMKMSPDYLIKKKRVIARSKVFKRFDSYYKFIELTRKKKNFKKWKDKIQIENDENSHIENKGFRDKLKFLIDYIIKKILRKGNTYEEKMDKNIL